MTKVMIVDDTYDIVQTLSVIMKKEGYEIETANNGQQLIDKIERVNPDLVLLDVMMPGLTTKQILAKLKELEIKTKIILITVVRFNETELSELKNIYNIVDYITKPFEVTDLQKRVKKQLS